MTFDIQNKLKQSYPVNLKKWPLIIAISCFIGFFLAFFQPFGLQFVEIENKEIVLFAYGIVTFFILVITLVLFPRIFNNYFDEENWTVGKQILWLNIDILLIALGNYLYSVGMDIFPWIGFKGMLIFIGYTVPIGLFPAVILTFLQQNRLLKQHLSSSSKLNEGLHQHIVSPTKEDEHLDVEVGTNTFSFDLSTLLCIVSEGNYLNVFSLKNDQVDEVQLRMTLTKMDKLIQKEYLMKCHRAFIVNLKWIDEVEGNAQGYSLSLKHLNQKIPVSRSFIPEFKQRMGRI